jgi:hypothetical protein
MRERWLRIEEFPTYAVSDHGRVMNTVTELCKNPSKNQQGILIVNFSVHNKQHVRAVVGLVAKAFLDDVERPGHFDTPIHMDGNKENCHVENLAWRPRWFAVKYHRQFYPEERARRYGYRQPVEIIETGEVFPTSWEAAVKYGLLDWQIFEATEHRTYVFPVNYHFRVLDD